MGRPRFRLLADLRLCLVGHRNLLAHKINRIHGAIAAWARLARVARLRLRADLPELVTKLAKPTRVAPRRQSPVRQGQTIYRALNFGPWHPRCLTLSLVHFSLLTDQGYTPSLVIGLPAEAKSHDAHAWVEIDGIDVGPPPGRTTELALARYPL